MKKRLSLFFAIAIGATAFAQESTDNSSLLKRTTYAGAGVAVGDGHFGGVLSAQNDWYLGSKRRIVVGTGLRFTGFLGNDIYFTSAPPELAADPLSVDSLLAPTPYIYSLNAMINLGFNITPKLTAGFNIDLVGLSFGPKGTPTFISQGQEQQANVSPTAVNILLVGDNDIGSLNSHFFAKYTFNEKWRIQLAYQFLFNELTTDASLQTVPTDNDRFRHKASQVLLGVTYQFGSKQAD